jgi:type IV pilus assembly protein PilE
MQIKQRLSSVYYQQGMTLIELMIVLVILSILALIAYPLYEHQMMKGRRADAQTALLNAISQEELFFSNNMTYTTNFASLGISAASNRGWYTLTLGTCGAGIPINSCVKVTATPTPGGMQEDDTVCSGLSITSRGVKSASNSICWN